MFSNPSVHIFSNIHPTTYIIHTTARAILSVNVVTTSKTAKKSLEVPGMCSCGSYDVEDGPVVSGGAEAVRGGTEGDESGTKVLFTSTTGTGCSPLGRSFAKSSSTSSYGCKRNESGIDRARSRDKI